MSSCSRILPISLRSLITMDSTAWAPLGRERLNGRREARIRALAASRDPARVQRDCSRNTWATKTIRAYWANWESRAEIRERPSYRGGREGRERREGERK
ncbi:UNVERIFIED_CONTAM: hypothetical protein FKN15_015061 [Acipenser sinensis]